MRLIALNRNAAIFSISLPPSHPSVPACWPPGSLILGQLLKLSLESVNSVPEVPDLRILVSSRPSNTAMRESDGSRHTNMSARGVWGSSVSTVSAMVLSVINYQ
jgi:hypothetical protein